MSSTAVFKMMQHSKLLTVFCGLLCMAGCATDSLLQTSKNVLTSPMALVRAAKGDKPVSKILCLWEPAEGQGLDERPGRGFAGQIMFFTHGSPSPIKVNSVVRIYEYSNFDADEIDPTPIHQFNFAPGAFEAHRTDGTLGHTYNVFLPYVEKGKADVICALRVEIEDKDGKKVSSPYTEVSLTGRNTLKPSTSIERGVVTKPPSPRHANVDAATKAETSRAASEQLDTLTISMPKSNR